MTSTHHLPYMPSLLLRALPALLLVAACGSSGPSGSGGAGGSGGGAGAGTPGKEPANHRPSSEPCTAPRPPGNQGDPSGECQLDTDCTMGMNGRCLSTIGGSECSYDECASDAECGGASVCKCRIPDTNDANQCFHGNCIVDADCGLDGYCSPSAVNIGASCSEGISPGSVGYFCHTAADGCTDDAECGNQGEAACIFQVESMKWSCFTLMCFD